MQATYSTNQSTTNRYGGGRVASDALRASRRLADDFAGLEEGADRYGLLLLVKRASKLAGFTPRMIQLLDYYLAYTRDVDWEAGGRPIVYQSLSRTALDLGVSERQVQKLEVALFEAGAITWNDSGNHKRYGQRCSDTGRIVYAYGIDLTPLASLRQELEATLEAKRRYDDDWMAAKRTISSLRREFRAHLAEWAERDGEVSWFAKRYERIAVQIRTHLDLAALDALLEEHTRLLGELRDAMGLGRGEVLDPGQPPSSVEETPKSSCTSEARFAHYKYITQPSKVLSSPRGKGLQESVAARAEPPGQVLHPGQASAMEHVSLGMAVGAASDRLTAHLPSDPGWGDLVEAAYRVRADLGVSQSSWGAACQLLGRNGAAVCLLVADRAALREVDPVRTPPAYFCGMVRRAETGELRLCKSLFGLLERSRNAETCAA